jgi:hypothetical protein
MARRRVSWLLIVLLFSLAGSPINAQHDTIFGIVEGFWFPEVTCELHPGWERIIFDWAQHQPEKTDDWHTLNVDDRWLKAANQCNREVVALLKNTPAWATDGTPGAGVPRGLDLPVDDPGNVWASFVRRTAAYYASRGINHFIIWNEPDIAPDTYGYEFEGTVEDYAQLLKDGYLAAKQGNPAAVIHLAGTTYWHDVNAGQRLYMDRLLELIVSDPDAPQNNFFFDIFSLHIYFRTDTVYDITTQARNLLDSYDLQDKRIWINETNAAPTDDPFWPVERPVYQIDLEQQAAFLMQAAALGLAADVERMAVYKLYDQNLPAGGESFGILSPADQSRRPAFITWQTVIRHLSDVTQARRTHNDQVDGVRLAHDNGHETILLWARTEAPVQIEVSASAEKAQLLDQYGNMTLLRPVHDYYTLTLPGATCNEVDGCAIGGPVSLLVQPASNTHVNILETGGQTRLVFE